jgi:hypothetical protein
MLRKSVTIRPIRLIRVPFAPKKNESELVITFVEFYGGAGS